MTHPRPTRCNWRPWMVPFLDAVQRRARDRYARGVVECSRRRFRQALLNGRRAREAKRLRDGVAGR